MKSNIFEVNRTKSNCFEVRNFGNYSTDLSSNIFDRVRIIFCKIFIEFISISNCIDSNYIAQCRTLQISQLLRDSAYFLSAHRTHTKDKLRAPRLGANHLFSAYSAVRNREKEERYIGRYPYPPNAHTHMS
jgi:hypothetical protein